MTGTGAGSDEPLSPAERQLLEQARRGHEWLRAVLCTVARRGVAYRGARPQAAAQLLAALATSPLYKAGQFLFDLMEWEDFMLEGTPPPLLPTVLDAAALVRLSQFFDQLRNHLESAQTLNLRGLPLAGFGEVFAAEPLPPLEGGFYLYEDVVLGVICSALPFVAAVMPA